MCVLGLRLTIIWHRHSVITVVLFWSAYWDKAKNVKVSTYTYVCMQFNIVKEPYFCKQVENVHMSVRRLKMNKLCTYCGQGWLWPLPSATYSAVGVFPTCKRTGTCQEKSLKLFNWSRKQLMKRFLCMLDPNLATILYLHCMRTLLWPKHRLWFLPICNVLDKAGSQTFKETAPVCEQRGWDEE